MSARALAAGLLRDRRGVAIIEFAYGLPVLLLAGLATMESANLVLAHMRISRIAAMTADNASRVRGTIDEQDVTELFLGAQLTSGALDVGGRGRIILSQVQENAAKTGQWIRWQRCYGTKKVASSYGLQDAGKNDNKVKGMGPKDKEVAASTDMAVNFVEVQYDYVPLVRGAFFGGLEQTLRYTNAFNVRKRTNPKAADAALTNSAGLAAKDRNPCTIT